MARSALVRALREALVEALRNQVRPRDIVVKGISGLGTAGMGLGVAKTYEDDLDGYNPQPYHYARNALYGAGATIAAPFVLPPALMDIQSWIDAARSGNIGEQRAMRMYDSVYDAMGDYSRPGARP